MKPKPTANQFLVRAHALAAGAGGVLLVANAIAGALGAPLELPAPFVWRDVALVFLLAALPLAASLATATIGRLHWSSHSLMVLLLEAIVLLVVPRLYIRARCDSDADRAVQLIGQSRLGEARELLHRILALAPEAQINGNSLLQMAASIDQIVRRIEDRVATPLPADAADEERTERAQQLAMLGRNREALAVLDSSAALADSPSAGNLRGTIHETQDQWRAARDWYGRAKAAWQAKGDSPERTAGVSQAITGIAFCERKLGRLRDAEAAWQELLALTPSADSHFLLAQFYEDTQQAAQARFHAQKAMRLAPDRYEVQGRRLIDKLVTSHFGCAGVFSAEFSPSTPFGRDSGAIPR